MVLLLGYEEPDRLRVVGIMRPGPLCRRGWRRRRPRRPGSAGCWPTPPDAVSRFAPSPDHPGRVCARARPRTALSTWRSRPYALGLPSSGARPPCPGEGRRRRTPNRSTAVHRGRSPGHRGRGAQVPHNISVMNSRTEQRGARGAFLALLWGVLGVLGVMGVLLGSLVVCADAGHREQAEQQARQQTQTQTQAQEQRRASGGSASAAAIGTQVSAGRGSVDQRAGDQPRAQGAHRVVAAEHPHDCPAGTPCWTRSQHAALHPVRTTLPGTVQALSALLPGCRALPPRKGGSGPALRPAGALPICTSFRCSGRRRTPAHPRGPSSPLHPRTAASSHRAAGRRTYP